MLNSSDVTTLREMAENGKAPSAIVRKVIEFLPEDEPGTVEIIMAMRHAFCMELHEASPIGGWRSDNSGEIPDVRLDEFLTDAIEAHRAEWSKS